MRPRIPNIKNSICAKIFGYAICGDAVKIRPGVWVGNDIYGLVIKSFSQRVRYGWLTVRPQECNLVPWLQTHQVRCDFSPYPTICSR